MSYEEDIIAELPDRQTSYWAEESLVLWEDLLVSWKQALELPFR